MSYKAPSQSAWSLVAALWNYAFTQEDHNTSPLLQEQVYAMVEIKGVIVDHGVLKVNGQELYLKDNTYPVPEGKCDQSQVVVCGV